MRLFTLLTLASLMQVASIAAAGEEESNVATRSQIPGCLTGESAIQDVKTARQENEAKQKELAQREKELKGKEQALSEEVKKLDQMREAISKIQETQRQATEEKVAKLVETLLAMSPKSASKILTTLDEGLAVTVLSRMDTAPLAKILNIMDPVRSSKLSELMTGVVRKVASNDAENGKRQSVKGGDKNDGHNERNEQSTRSELKQPSRPEPAREKTEKPH